MSYLRRSHRDKPLLYLLMSLSFSWFLAGHLRSKSDIHCSDCGIAPVPDSLHDSPQWTSYFGSQTSLATEEGPSIKPLAYLFPQYHAFPENDQFWGINFTEWNNVNKTIHNKLGTEVMKPSSSIGYYNLLDYATRKRQADLLRKMRFHGVAYHHYWFGGRGPIMTKVLEAMLKDGQPDVPFILSWANEPWTRRWDGAERGDSLLSQDYRQVSDWRAHFDWMLPYFRHPNYIKVNGRIQFAVYNPAHIGYAGKRMYEAWRTWAIEAGFIGMDIIETYWSTQGSPTNWGPVDAINEFQPHSGGFDTQSWVSVERKSRVYHRGAMVTFDNTPRHSVDPNGAAIDQFAHPKLWKIGITQVMQRMKLEPNPHGEANFFFVNALNEWGEGNTLEESMQWGSQWSAAFREARDSVDSMPWRDELIEQGENLSTEPFIDVDVCVLIRVADTAKPFNSPFDVPQTLRSLQGQTNGRWRAVVYQGDKKADMDSINRHVGDTFDPRIESVTVPAAGLPDRSQLPKAFWQSTDWMLANLANVSKSCASASYMLLVNSGHTYEPTTFELANSPASEPDIIGLTFSTLDVYPPYHSNLTQDQYCTRLTDDAAATCAKMSPTSSVADMGALLIKISKWNTANISLVGEATDHPKGAAIYFKELVSQANSIWSWPVNQIDPPGGSACQFILGATYLACRNAGMIWLDLPDMAQIDAKIHPGCYTPASIKSMFTESWVPWDYQAWLQDPLCLRFSKETLSSTIAKTG